MAKLAFHRRLQKASLLRHRALHPCSSSKHCNFILSLARSKQRPKTRRRRHMMATPLAPAGNRSRLQYVRLSSMGLKHGRVRERCLGAYELERSSSCPWACSSLYTLELIRAQAQARPSYYTRRSRTSSNVYGHVRAQALELGSRGRACKLARVFEFGRVRWTRLSSDAPERGRV